MPKPIKTRTRHLTLGLRGAAAGLAGNLCLGRSRFCFISSTATCLLYGDAVAHINIARRVFDSKTPGLLQLGTVWLPLPHLLMIPFLLSELKCGSAARADPFRRWSPIVFGVIGIFRLVRGVACAGTCTGPASSRLAAWTAAVVYAANPNLIYLQPPPWANRCTWRSSFGRWSISARAVRGEVKSLIKCGLCLAAACLTRYDGWLLAAAMAVVIVAQSLFAAPTPSSSVRLSRSAVLKFVLLAAAAPALWLAYNGIVYRNPLEFANGPYSAKAIERKSQSGSNPGHPGSGNPLLAGMYFLKSAEANVAENQWLQRTWLLTRFDLSGRGIRASSSQSRRFEIGCLRHSWPLALLARPTAFLRALHCLWRSSDFHSAMVAILSLQRRATDCNCFPPSRSALALLVHLAVRAEAWNQRLRLACVLALFAFG